MNTKEIVSKLADKQRMSKAETRRLLDTIVEQMSIRLINHGAVHISDLGTFQADALDDKDQVQNIRFFPAPSMKTSNNPAVNREPAPSLDQFITSQDERSETFMREFLNDFVHTIQKSLNKDEKANIAKWGKFEVQTEDDTDMGKQKIKFTPYKQLRQQLAKQGDKVPSKSEASRDESKTHSTDVKQEKTQKTSSNPKKSVPGQSAKWISAGVAFLAGTVGAWFFFKDDD